MKLTSSLSHIEINVGDYASSIQFYDKVLTPLGWERLVCTKTHTTYSDGFMKLILSPVDEKHKSVGFHRKRIGLNHLAFHVQSQDDVDTYYKNILIPHGISSLYQDGPDGDKDYYSVLFEDPDRMKLEVVYSPNYQKKDHWPNNIENDFDPIR